MKIVLTGGGTGGHFYPLIAVAEALHLIADREKVISLKLFYCSDSPYDKEALFENQITYKYVPAGKRRLYSSTENITDMFKAGLGTLSALFTLFTLYPDAVFSKGGYGSFPVVLAARLLGIPVILHESDSVPGRVNAWTGKFAKRIALSYEEAMPFFPKERTAVTGQPVRALIENRNQTGAFDYLKLDPTIPTIFVIGGSLGAEVLNNVVLDSLPTLLSKYQVIHQTGAANIDEVKSRARFMLEKDPELTERYKPFPFLNPLAMKMAAGAATLVVTRAGSMLFEIAAWGIPCIIIPITVTNGDHQRKNAFNYARHGGGVVIEEGNLSPTILLSEIDRYLMDRARWEKMSAAAKTFATKDAAEKIAKQIVDIALSHEK